MIAIAKVEPPERWRNSAAVETERLLSAYDADPQAFRDGEESFTFSLRVLADAEMRAILARVHYGKCCYCETPLRGASYAHLEHWRPKSSSRQVRGGGTTRPGYYWLAYNWDNLLWSCGPCNSQHKGDLFPLEDPSRRALDHHMSLLDELPELVHPALDRPREHIVFHYEIPLGITALGRKTIEVLGLDKIREERLRYLDQVRTTWELYDDLKNSVDPVARRHAFQARDILLAAVATDRPFSALVIDFLRRHPVT